MAQCFSTIPGYRRMENLWNQWQPSGHDSTHSSLSPHHPRDTGVDGGEGGDPELEGWRVWPPKGWTPTITVPIMFQ